MPNWPIEPDPAGVIAFLNYSIFLSDPEEYDAAVLSFGGVQVMRSPGYVRDTLTVPMTAVWGDPKWFYFYPPPWVMNFNLDGTWGTPLPIKDCKAYIYPHSPSEDPYWWPPSQFTFDWAQDWNGAPAYPTDKGWGRGKAVSWIWCGYLTLAGANNDPAETAYNPPKDRRFFTGFETTNGGQTAPSNSPEGDGGTIWSEVYSRCASRTPDGIGFACRDSQSINRVLNALGTVNNNINSWERFYIRILKYPTAVTEIWTMTTSGGGTVSITINSSGTLNSYCVNNFTINSGPLGAGDSFALNKWYRIDIYIFLLINPAGCGCTGSLTSQSEVGGVSLTIPAVNTNVGFGPIQEHHSSSQLGPRADGQDMEVDFDDWGNMDPGNPLAIPSEVDYALTYDYKVGVHAQLIRNVSLSAPGTWTGDYRASQQSPTAAPIAVLFSAIASDAIGFYTELDGLATSPISAVRQAGPVAMNAMITLSKDILSTTDQLGLILKGVPNMETINMGVNLQSYTKLQIIPPDVDNTPPDPDVYEPTESYHIKSSDVHQNNLSLLMIEALFVGAYGLEDSSSVDINGTPAAIGYHNAPYYTSLLAREVTPGINSVAIASGTYVGNGTGQDITIELPGIHFIYIRNTSTNVKTWWWTTMIGPHAGVIADDILPGLITRVWWAPTGDTIISVAGANTHSNENGITYQYFAFSDVASRILLNTTWRHSNNDQNNALFDDAFLPEFVMIMQENVKNNSPGELLWLKGPGLTADSGKLASGTVNANIATLETGNIVSRSALTSGNLNNAVACWRSWDGGDSVPNIIYIGQYTGDGTANRDVATPLNGRRPIFAIIAPVTNAVAAYCRDASHSTSVSTTVAANGTSATAIKGGGIDFITVGITLNANAVVYSVLVFPSCSVDTGNDGWGVDLVCGIAEPGWNGPGQPTAPNWYAGIPDIPADIVVIGSGGLVISGETAKLLILDLSGIYTIVPGKSNDTLLDRQVGQTELIVKIPDPLAKTGYIGG